MTPEGTALAAVVVLAVMALAWLWQRRFGNAGIVDLLWGSAVGALALAHVRAGIACGGWPPRAWLAGGLVGFWSVRLTYLLGRRLATEPEDGRYTALRDELGDRFQGWLLVFYLMQGALAVALAGVFWVLARAPEPGWRLVDALAVGLWVLAQLGESLADRQLSRWRSDPANRGVTCRAGLWRYSRHPNYFFEWLHWIAYALMGTGLPWGWILWAAPALMLLLVLKVTGIPPTEARALVSRGDDYRAYQRTTSAFVPWFPSRAQSSRSAT